ncbi:MAG TPA: hypothetical protein VE570_11850 [Thermoleophilaceae bacterium]|jgi:hypothetical protein|nr:hypothetical protein [Thermoleophilaceae bacterium]
MKGIALHPSVLQMARAADVAWVRDELAYEWRAAQDDAVAAYRARHDSPGPLAHAAFRAAQDRADQAQDVLADSAEVQTP